MIEEWKVYKDTTHRVQGALWEVSNFGRIRKNGVIYETRPNNAGYLMAGTCLVHRVEAQMFIPNPENKGYVDHIDGNKLNNMLDNLRWVTAKENSNNPITYKRMIENNKSDFSGANNPMYGCIRPEEWRKHQSEVMKGNKANTGRKFSDEWRANISKGRKGTHLSLESLEKRREKMRLKKITEVV